MKKVQKVTKKLLEKYKPMIDEFVENEAVEDAITFVNAKYVCEVDVEDLKKTAREKILLDEYKNEEGFIDVYRVFLNEILENHLDSARDKYLNILDYVEAKMDDEDELSEIVLNNFDKSVSKLNEKEIEEVFLDHFNWCKENIRFELDLEVEDLHRCVPAADEIADLLLRDDIQELLEKVGVDYEFEDRFEGMESEGFIIKMFKK